MECNKKLSSVDITFAVVLFPLSFIGKCSYVDRQYSKIMDTIDFTLYVTMWEPRSSISRFDEPISISVKDYCSIPNSVKTIHLFSVLRFHYIESSLRLLSHVR